MKAVELSPHTDYQLKATILMSNLRQAISAVSGLHRYKIGCKRIQVSLITGCSNKSLALLRCESSDALRSRDANCYHLKDDGWVLFSVLKFQPYPLCSTEIMSILQDSPANCLPLFKLTEIYEKKYVVSNLTHEVRVLADARPDTPDTFFAPLQIFPQARCGGSVQAARGRVRAGAGSVAPGVSSAQQPTASEPGGIVPVPGGLLVSQWQPRGVRGAGVPRARLQAALLAE